MRRKKKKEVARPTTMSEAAAFVRIAVDLCVVMGDAGKLADMAKAVRTILQRQVGRPPSRVSEVLRAMRKVLELDPDGYGLGLAMEVAIANLDLKVTFPQFKTIVRHAHRKFPTRKPSSTVAKYLLRELGVAARDVDNSTARERVAKSRARRKEKARARRS